MLLAASTQPAATMALKPSMATPMARTHMRMRVQSPMLTMSATAPMVQKCVRWAMAPKATASPKAAHSTVAVRPGKSDSCMRGTLVDASPGAAARAAAAEPARRALAPWASAEQRGLSAAGPAGMLPAGGPKALRGGHFSAARRSLPATAASDLG